MRSWYIDHKLIYAFIAIGCAGEIRLSEAEDYSQWCIEILVKFRERENLQLLTAQRQSGGVRSSYVICVSRDGTESYILMLGTVVDNYYVPHVAHGVRACTFLSRGRN